MASGRAHGLARHVGIYLGLLGRASTLLGDADAARAHLDEAATVLAAGGFQEERVRVELWRVPLLPPEARAGHLRTWEEAAGPSPSVWVREALAVARVSAAGA